MREINIDEMEFVSGGMIKGGVAGWFIGKALDAAWGYVSDVQPVDMGDPVNPANVYGA